MTRAELAKLRAIMSTVYGITSIDDVPTVRQALNAWRDTVSSEIPRGDVALHNAYCAAVRDEQYKRGQIAAR